MKTKKKYERKVVALVATFAMVMSLFISPTIVSAETATNEAKIGSTEYGTLAEAFQYATNGQEIDVLTNVTLGSTVNFEDGRTVTLDLNGKTITCATDTAIYVQGGSKLTVKDSTVSGAYTEANYAGYQGGRIISNADRAIRLYGSHDSNWSSAINSEVILQGGSIEGQEGGITVRGNGAKFTLTNGYVVGYDNAAIMGNGTFKPGENYGGTTININGGVMIGKIQSPGWISAGIYHPQSGTLNITGGTIVSEKGAGIVMRNGVLNMSGGTIKTSGADFTGGVGDATPKIGTEGIAVDFLPAYNSNGSPRTVSITGGSITTTGGMGAVSVYYNHDDSKTDNAVTISGGTFSIDPSEFLVADKMSYKNDDGVYVIAPKSTAPTVPTRPTSTVNVGVNDEDSQNLVTTTTTAVISEIAEGRDSALVDDATKANIQAAFAANKTITSEVVSKTVAPSEVSTTIKNAIIAEVKESAGTTSAATIIQYLDLGINLVTTDGQVLGSINSLGSGGHPGGGPQGSSAIKFTVVIPTVEVKAGRTFYAVGYHSDGTTDKILLTETGTTGVYELDASKFSTYAIVYEEAPTAGKPAGSVSTPRESTGTTGGTTAKATTAKTGIVKTGDENQLGVYMAVGFVSLMACLGLIAGLKRKEQ